MLPPKSIIVGVEDSEILMRGGVRLVRGIIALAVGIVLIIGVCVSLRSVAWDTVEQQMTPRNNVPVGIVPD